MVTYARGSEVTCIIFASNLVCFAFNVNVGVDGEGIKIVISPVLCCKSLLVIATYAVSCKITTEIYKHTFTFCQIDTYRVKKKIAFSKSTYKMFITRSFIKKIGVCTVARVSSENTNLTLST